MKKIIAAALAALLGDYVDFTGAVCCFYTAHRCLPAAAP